MRNVLAIFRNAARELLPPVLGRAYRRLLRSRIYFQGPYLSWAEARRQSTGYDTDEILGRVRAAIVKARAASDLHERDSVLLDKPPYSFPVLAGLLLTAIGQRGNLNVLDFGGSLGSTYHLYRPLLSDLASIRWNVVEQPSFVACGRSEFESTELRFYYTIEECLQHEQPRVVLLSSTLQYLEDPYSVLAKILACNFEYVILDRVSFTPGEQDLLTVQVVPKTIYSASYPAWIFSRARLLGTFDARYSQLAEFDCPEQTIGWGRLRAEYKGFLYRAIHT